MNCRKANIVLIIIVSTLLIITCLVLIKFLFSDNEGFEWGSVSDWFSSTANLIMAGAALYAAWNAKNWFQTKIKENALNQVTKFWANCDLFSLEILKTYENVRILNNTDPDYEPKDFVFLVSTEREVIDRLLMKLMILENELQSLAFWKVSPKDESIFDDYFCSNQLALQRLREAIGFDVNDINERFHYNQNYGRMLVDTSRKLRKTHASLKKDMNNLFYFSN